VRFVFNHSQLVNAGKSRSDGADIRFTNDNCQNFHYWFEAGLNTASCTVWVKVDSIPASTSRDIWMFYGNALAASVSNPDSVFMFYDDFSGIANGQAPSSSKWVTSSAKVQNGKLRLYTAFINKPLG